jgi:hypothetical protein
MPAKFPGEPPYVATGRRASADVWRQKIRWRCTEVAREIPLDCQVGAGFADSEYRVGSTRMVIMTSEKKKCGRW